MISGAFAIQGFHLKRARLQANPSPSAAHIAATVPAVSAASG
jgi:hypothetical protein